MGFIKVFDLAVRDELVNAGFKYMVEHYDKDKEVYAFTDSKELREYVMQNFADNKLVFSNKLYF